MKIKTVTVTGADDSVTVSKLAEIAEEFPFVEFGILLSKKAIGRSRFPAEEWLNAVRKLPPSVRLSGHICGRWVQEILMGNWPDEDFEHLLGSNYLRRYSRFQLNTHGKRHDWSTRLFHIPEDVVEIIYQKDDQHDDLLRSSMEHARWKVSTLFDMSHGAGVLPEDWPSILEGVYCGYAGGLSPENVAGQCDKIERIVGDAEIWVDAETHLREPESHFDLKKVREFLRGASKWT